RGGRCRLAPETAPRQQRIPDGDRVVHQGAERHKRNRRSPQRQTVAPQPTRVAVDQLDVDPVDEQRRAAESRKAVARPGHDRRGGSIPTVALARTIGVAIATIAVSADNSATRAPLVRAAAQTIPAAIIDGPITFRMSTRNSVSSAPPGVSSSACRRNRKASAKI